MVDCGKVAYFHIWLLRWSLNVLVWNPITTGPGRQLLFPWHEKRFSRFLDERGTSTVEKKCTAADINTLDFYILEFWCVQLSHVNSYHHN